MTTSQLPKRAPSHHHTNFFEVSRSVRRDNRRSFFDSKRLVVVCLFLWKLDVVGSEAAEPPSDSSFLSDSFENAFQGLGSHPLPKDSQQRLPLCASSGWLLSLLFSFVSWQSANSHQFFSEICADVWVVNFAGFCVGTQKTVIQLLICSAYWYERTDSVKDSLSASNTYLI